MPALLGPLVAVALGAALAWLVRGDAPTDDDAAFRARVAVVVLYAGLVFAPACGYFMVFAGDWSLFYLADTRRIPSALGLVLVVMDAALVAVAFAVGHLMARRRQARALMAMVLVPAAMTLTGAAAFLPKLRVDGTYHQVTSRFGTTPVAGGPLGWAIVWMGAMIAVGFALTARSLTARPRVVAPPAKEGGGPAPKQPLLGRRR